MRMWVGGTMQGGGRGGQRCAGILVEISIYHACHIFYRGARDMQVLQNDGCSAIKILHETQSS